MAQLIGIQGGEASYHEQAARQLHPDGELAYFSTFAALFDALRDRQISTAVCATRNTRVGDIKESNAELAALEGRYRQVGHLMLPIRHILLGVQGSTLADVQYVYSQQPALDQCQKFLADRLPTAGLVAREDTALSAKFVAEMNDPANAAIASAAAGILYELKPLYFDTQDDPDNATEFIEIALN